VSAGTQPATVGGSSSPTGMCNPQVTNTIPANQSADFILTCASVTIEGLGGLDEASARMGPNTVTVQVVAGVIVTFRPVGDSALTVTSSPRSTAPASVLLNGDPLVLLPGHSLTLARGEPRSQGYWHRQCLGTGEIRPGRNGRGPSFPTEPGFVSDLEPCGDARLESLGFYGTTTCEGLDAVPPSDPCERALKQLTALILNVCSERLLDSFEVDVTGQGCSSPSVGDLIDEIASLIQDGQCQTASDCAAAMNEGTGSTEGVPLLNRKPKPEVKKPASVSGTGAQGTITDPGPGILRPVERRDRTCREEAERARGG